MNRKAGTPLAIALLTIGIILVFIAAWLTFLGKQDIKDIQLRSPDVLDSIYAREAELNFQLSRLTKESVDEIFGEITPGSFLKAFKANLEERNIKSLFPELKEIDSQLIEQNVQIANEQLTLTLEIKIDKAARAGQRELLSAEYTYKQDFTADFPLI